VTKTDAFASIKPFNGFKVAFKVDFDHPVHKKLPAESIIDFSSTSFVKKSVEQEHLVLGMKKNYYNQKT
jgi:UDP-3-O-[3-hydroxymyristoyl] N-acetylglucosamine deacetylase